MGEAPPLLQVKLPEPKLFGRSHQKHSWLSQRDNPAALERLRRPMDVAVVHVSGQERRSVPVRTG